MNPADTPTANKPNLFPGSQTAPTVSTVPTNGARAAVDRRLAQAHPDDARAELQRTITEILRAKIGLNETYASQMAADVIEGLQEWYPADTVYIPARSKRERNQAIRAAFNGRNHDAVMRQFHISRTTLYAILNHERD